MFVSELFFWGCGCTLLHVPIRMAALWQSFMDAPDYYEESPAFPNPAICIRDMVVTGSREVVRRLPWNGVGVWLNETWYWISQAQYNDPSAIMMPVLIAILITLFRMTLNWAVFYVCCYGGVMHDANSSHFSGFLNGIISQQKQRTSFLRVFLSCFIIWVHGSGHSVWWYQAETFSSTFVLIGMVCDNYSLAQCNPINPLGWSSSVALEPGLYWLYMTQIGFYLHCIYATLYMETIRRDFSVMMTHHVLTIGLLLFSYVIRL